jgi:hypothetical protein
MFRAVSAPRLAALRLKSPLRALHFLRPVAHAVEGQARLDARVPIISGLRATEEP